MSKIEISIAIATVFITYVIFLISRKDDNKPIIVIEFDENNEEWKIRNLGKGPTIDLIVLHKYKKSISWEYPVRIPPLNVNEEKIITWKGGIINANAVLAYYRDSLGNNYRVKCKNDKLRIKSCIINRAIFYRNIIPLWRAER